MINIAFFEDHPIVSKSLEMLFNQHSDMNLLFTASRKNELEINLAKYTSLDVIIIDVLAIDVQGLEVFEMIKLKYPNFKQIAFTTLTSPILIENLLSVGVLGYVNKNQEIEDLIEAINLVYDNKIYLPNDYQFLIKRTENSGTISLTEREIEIMQLIIREFTTADIASELRLSVNTIENHRKSIFQKFNVKNVAGMVREASKLGFVN
jgi:DNA-binding NarL/FixJ family response regulator